VSRVASETKDADVLTGQTARGRYRLIRELGSGQTGRVFLAEQEGSAERVTLRILPRELSDNPEFVRKFHQLASSVVAVSTLHPALLAVHACEQAGDGRLFVVYEHVEGRPLSDVIREKGTLPVEQALRVALQLGEGLETVHNNAGLVHGEIRPANIIVTDPDEAVKIRGFDIAQWRKSRAIDRRTRPPGLTGAPEHRAPEQIRREEISEQTDIYGFGAVVYEMLSGVAPLGNSTSDRVRSTQPGVQPAPLSKLRDGIPASVEHLVMQTLDTMLENRPRDMSQIVNALWMAMHRLSPGSARPRRGTARTIALALGLLASIVAPLAWMARAQWGVMLRVEPSAAPRATASLDEPMPLAGQALEQPVGRLDDGDVAGSRDEARDVARRAAGRSEPSRGGTGAVAAEPPDPAAIIDWLLSRDRASQQAR